jgi:hypothetical protein
MREKGLCESRSQELALTDEPSLVEGLCESERARARDESAVQIEECGCGHAGPR